MLALALVEVLVLVEVLALAEALALALAEVWMLKLLSLPVWAVQ